MRKVILLIIAALFLNGCIQVVALVGPAVTGAASGIGKGISSTMAEQGAVVVVADKFLEGAQEVAKSLRQSGSTVEAIELDVTNESSIDKMIRDVISKYDHIDGLINNNE